MTTNNIEKPVILFGVTTSLSLILMRGYPQSLVDLGWQVHVASSPGAELEDLVTTSQCHTHSLEMERAPSPFRDLRSLTAWIRLIRKIKPDIVSFGTPKAGLLGMLASRLCRVPRRVYHLRGLRLEGETCMKYKVLRALEKITCFCATDVLAVSPSLRAAAIHAGIVAPAKINVLGAGSSNGVDLEHFAPHKRTRVRNEQLLAELGLVPGVPVIGFVGRLSADKGLHGLMRAHQRLKQRNVDHQMLVVGIIEDEFSSTNGDDALGDFLESTIQSGYVSDTEPYYHLMDVLTLPTRREGLPNVAIEAQAAGVPVITTDVTGARDAIEDGLTGLLVPFGDDEKLANAVEDILSNPKERDSMAINARQFVTESFDRRRVWQALNDYYEKGNSVSSALMASE